MTSIDTFVSQENSATQGRGASGINLDYNAAGGAAAGSNLGTITPLSGQNAVIGFQSAVFNGGHDVVLLDGPRANYAIQVSSTGVTTIKDIGNGGATFGQTITVTGESNIIFNGAHISLSDPNTVSTTANPYGVINYPNDLYYVLSPANSQLAQFYAATLTWEPQISLPGFEYWETRLAQGMSLTSIAQSFINTPYFQQNFGDPGTTHAQHVTYVETLYKNILGMTLDSTNAGVQYWVSDMDTGVLDGAGTLISFTNATSTTSLINAAPGVTAGAGTGWLINYGITGGYADPGLQETATTVLTQGAANNYYDTGLIDLSGMKAGDIVTVNGVTVGVSTDPTYNIVKTANNNVTIVLSSSFPTCYVTGQNATIIGSRSGGDIIMVQNGAVYLNGPNNSIEAQVANGTINGGAIQVVGFDATDHIITGAGEAGMPNGSTAYPNATMRVLAPTGAAPLNGVGLNFVANSYFVYVGNVGTGTPAEVATAANTVYKVGDVNAVFTTGTSNNVYTQLGESVVFYGQAGSDTVIYGWGKSTSLQSADINSNHLVDASEFSTSVITLLGVQATSLTAANFAHY